MTAARLIATMLTAGFLAGCGSTPQPVDIAATYQGSGDVVEYHPNGKVKRKTAYDNGQLVSVVSFYASGTEESNEHYQQGRIHSATYFYSSGRVKTEVIGN
jgi:antitoxin component YwqK of YwqJK toxin-antitoxin module